MPLLRILFVSERERDRCNVFIDGIDFAARYHDERLIRTLTMIVRKNELSQFRCDSRSEPRAIEQAIVSNVRANKGFFHPVRKLHAKPVRRRASRCPAG